MNSWESWWMSSQTFVPGTQIKNTLYSLHFVVHPFKNIHWKKKPVSTYFDPAPYGCRLSANTVHIHHQRKSGTWNHCHTHYHTKFFTLYVLFCAKKGFLIVTLNKNLSTCIVFWKPVHFSIECWFQPLLIRYCILHVCPLNKKCLEHTLWWLHSFPSLWDISYTIFTTFKYTHWLIQQFTCRHFFGLGSRLQFQHKRMPWTPRLCKELKNLSLSLSTWYIKSFSKEYYYSLSINKARSKQTHQPLWSPPTRVLSANL